MEMKGVLVKLKYFTVNEDGIYQQIVMTDEEILKSCDNNFENIRMEAEFNFGLNNLNTLKNLNNLDVLDLLDILDELNYPRSIFKKVSIINVFTVNEDGIYQQITMTDEEFLKSCKDNFSNVRLEVNVVFNKRKLKKFYNNTLLSTKLLKALRALVEKYG